MTGWLKAFDGKKIVPDDFMDGVASCIPIRTVNQEQFYQKQPSIVGETKQFFIQAKLG